MQSEKIILIPPTHEQTVYTFHVEGSIADSFARHLAESGIEPWRPPEEQDKIGADGRHIIQIETDTNVTEEKLRESMNSFVESQA